MKSLLIAATFLNVFSYGICGQRLWTKVNVEHDKISKSNDLIITETEKITSNLKIFRSLKCDKENWCKVACLDSSGSYLFSNVEVSPFYVNQSEGLDCYTKVNKDLICHVLKIEDSGTVPTGYPMRTPQQLLKRINLKHHNQCLNLESDGTQRMWIVIELDKKFEIETVVLSPQTYKEGSEFRSEPQYKFRNIEIKVGNAFENGNFSSYKLLGRYESENDRDETIAIKGNEPIKGKYVSVEKFYGNDDELFLVCFLQIFGNGMDYHWF